MVLWSYGLMVLLSYSLMVLWPYGLMALWSYGKTYSPVVLLSYGLLWSHGLANAVLCLNDNDDFYFVWTDYLLRSQSKAAAAEQLQFCEKGLHLLIVNLKVE